MRLAKTPAPGPMSLAIGTLVFEKNQKARAQHGSGQRTLVESVVNASGRSLALRSRPTLRTTPLARAFLRLMGLVADVIRSHRRGIRFNRRGLAEDLSLREIVVERKLANAEDAHGYRGVTDLARGGARVHVRARPDRGPAHRTMMAKAAVHIAADGETSPGCVRLRDRRPKRLSIGIDLAKVQPFAADRDAH